MVKIKDFTLASKNLGGTGPPPPCPTHLPPMYVAVGATRTACKPFAVPTIAKHFTLTGAHCSTVN